MIAKKECYNMIWQLKQLKIGDKMILNEDQHDVLELLRIHLMTNDVKDIIDFIEIILENDEI